MKPHHILIMLLFFCTLSGCKGFLNDISIMLNNTSAETIGILDQAAANLNANNENFVNIIEAAIDSIEETSVKDQLENALGFAVTLASTELKCNIQFTADYLIKRIDMIKASLLNTPKPETRPVVCTSFPSTIKMRLKPRDRELVLVTGYFLLDRSENYKLELWKANGTKSDHTKKLTINSDYQLTINLGKNGIPFDKNSDKLVLIWENDVISEIPIIQPHQEKCAIKERTITVSSQVVKPVHKNAPGYKIGDKELGKIVCTSGNVSIYKANNDTELWALIFVQMWECPDDLGFITSDKSYGDVRKHIKLKTMDYGWRIKTIKITQADYFQDIDREKDRIHYEQGSGPVLRYNIQGSVRGNDLGNSYVCVFRSI